MEKCVLLHCLFLYLKYRTKIQETVQYDLFHLSLNKKHLKNVGPICHCEPPHAALPFTMCHRLRIDVHNNNDDNDNA